MDRETIIKDLDRAVKNGLMETSYSRHHFTLRKDYIYLHINMKCNPYTPPMSNHAIDSFSLHLRIPTNEYSYRRLANELRKARKEHDTSNG
mgnify:CR=1 FL=1